MGALIIVASVIIIMLVGILINCIIKRRKAKKKKASLAMPQHNVKYEPKMSVIKEIPEEDEVSEMYDPLVQRSTFETSRKES